MCTLWRFTKSTFCATRQSLRRTTTRSEALQVFLEILLLFLRELELEHLHVVIDDVVELLRASIVKVRRVMRKAAQRRGAILLLAGAHCVRRVHAGLGRLGQYAGVVGGRPAADVTARAIRVENDFATRGLTVIV